MNIDTQLLLWLITLPIGGGALFLLIPERVRSLKEIAAIFISFINLSLAVYLFGKPILYTAPWGGFGMEFSLKLYHFSSLIITMAALFGFLVAVYSTVFVREKPYRKPFWALFMITLGLVNGAVLADNLALMLFFWEGLLLTQYGMIAIGNKFAFRTAAKAFIITGVGDIFLMVGILLCGHISGTLAISQMHIPATGIAGIAFLFMMFGAISKGGVMPFHSWIPDAALDAPLPFMAILPGAMEKLLGIYLLTRISLDIFIVAGDSRLSYLLMMLGALTILFAVMMALIQKDYKRLLSYHAISQIGYMVLGIGTMVPAGIIGGIFHMVNNVIYKCGLFLTAGSVERQAGGTNLEELGGLARPMPITFISFIIMAASISGVPPFNGFFSKELVYDGALERGWIFYAAAVLGSFFTAASFIKLGHAAFLGKRTGGGRSDVKEAPMPMLIPMIFISFLCIMFGLFNSFPVNHLIAPVLGSERLEGHVYGGLAVNPILTSITILVLLSALINHRYGYKRYGSSLKAVDHIHYAPIIGKIYEKAEKGYLDPYRISGYIIRMMSRLLLLVDRFVDWIYSGLTVTVTTGITKIITTLHSGSYKTYIVWSIAAAGAITIILCLHY